MPPTNFSSDPPDLTSRLTNNSLPSPSPIKTTYPLLSPLTKSSTPSTSGQISPNPILSTTKYDQATILKNLRYLERGLRSRLLSIEYDTRQALLIYTLLHPAPQPNRPTPSSLPLFANSRAGCWYVPPIVRDTQTYICSFKSADGHYGKWSSSLRRPNIHVLRAALTSGAAVVIDVTRAGKAWPDALTKTLPIWCAVISIAAGLVKCNCDSPKSDVSTCLNCVPLKLHPSVPESEKSQIITKLPQWVAEWRRGVPDLPRLVRALSKGTPSTPLKPVRPLWVSPGRIMWDRGLPLNQLNFIPIVCVSASKVVPNSIRSYIEPLPSTSVCGVTFSDRDSGFPYVQGAGDDQENWSLGLTPTIFWENREHLLKEDLEVTPSVAEDQLRERIVTLVQSLGDEHRNIYSRPVATDGAKGREFGTVVWESRIRIVRAPLHNLKKFVKGTAKSFGCVIVLGSQDPDLPPPVILSRRASSVQGSDAGRASSVASGTDIEKSISLGNANTSRSTDDRKMSVSCERLREFEIDLQTDLTDDDDDEDNADPMSRVTWIPLTDRKGKIDYKYGFGRALGPGLSLLRRCCVDREKEALICCTGKDGDWCAGMAIAWLAWHCIPSEVSLSSCSLRTAETFFDETIPGYRISTERRCTVSQIPKERVHAVMLHFMSTFPQFQLSRATLKQLNRFFSSPEPSSTVSELR